jgi:glycosyltransferase involved in cell wall biosynthesis
MKVDHSRNVTCGIPTKNRYDTLALTFQSVALQTVKPDSVIIVDDSDQPTDLRTLLAYQSVFQLLDVYGIG